ncbi:hypothetical protein BKA70DRAFT_1190361 [Coprinopsis sp. MPI-PUGE-AT-0042]|nr:hypothetical protein BKA70DRAFT_1190361 [Coprinopsis sp. MPI-PUGE-AT-0042]
MVSFSLDSRHDEVNLHRLLRRLEKSVQTPEEWHVDQHDDGPSGLVSGRSGSQIRLKAQKDIQMVKYARKLVRNVESNGYESESVDSYGTLDRDGGKIHELNDVKIRLDRVESFLKDITQKHTEPLRRPPSLLARLPKPAPTPPLSIEVTDSEFGEPSSVDLDSTPAHSERAAGPADNLLLSPPELEGMTSPGLEFDYPPLYSPAVSPLANGLRPGTAAASSAVAPNNSNATSRKPQSAAHASLQEELSSQLESMAAQLKRNAIHFSTNLANDKAVVEAAGEKLERNYDVMQVEKGRLGRLNKITGGTTWMTLGIVLVVLLTFIVMIGVIRFSRT